MGFLSHTLAASIFLASSVYSAYLYPKSIQSEKIVQTDFSIDGVPYTEARGWHFTAISSVDSRGVSAYAWPAFRPGFGIFPLYLRHLGLTWKKAALLLSVMLRGMGIGVGPWLPRQKLTHDIWSLSDGIAPTLYEATTPKFGNWRPNVSHDLPASTSTLKEQYEFYNPRAWENIFADPGYYLQNVSRNFSNSLFLPQRLPSQSTLPPAYFPVWPWPAPSACPGWSASPASGYSPSSPASPSKAWPSSAFRTKIRVSSSCINGPTSRAILYTEPPEV